MLQWLLGTRNRSRRASTPKPNRIRPRVEGLEPRWCPAGPAITAFSAAAVQGQGNTVVLTGTVTDPGASSVSVTFQGVASVTTVVSNGSFSVQTQASALGTIVAQAIDNLSLSSSQVSTQLAVAAPTLTFTVSQAGQHNVTVSGQVTAQAPGGLTVTLSGVVTGTATTTSTGSFSWAGTATNLGQVNGAVTDVWSQTGNGTAQLTNAPPSIIGFTASFDSTIGAWTFTGQVRDEYAAGLTVVLSGIPGQPNVSVTVCSNNWFYDTVVLNSGASGTVSASVTDWWGAVSQTVTTPI
jgi:hypothetical protein